MYSRSAKKGGEKGDPNRNPWLAKMQCLIHKHIFTDYNLILIPYQFFSYFEFQADYLFIL